MNAAAATPDRCRRRLRVGAAFATAAAVFVLTYLAEWEGRAQSVALGHGYGRLLLASNYKWISNAVEDFAKKHGRYPNSLEELPQDDLPRDPWGHPFVYEKTKDGFKIRCLGRDGKPGGVGLDADFELDPQGRVTIQPTFRQFVFEGGGSGMLFCVAFASSVCAGITSYLAAPMKGAWPGILGSIVTAGLIAGAALLIAAFLVACYLGILGSGH